MICSKWCRVALAASLVIFISSAGPALAQEKEAAALPEGPLPAAKLQIYPTRIQMKPGQNAAELNVINGGTATGQYRLTLQDMKMPEDGVLEAVPEGQEGPFSLKPYVRATPRSVTVPSGQSQKFRLMLRLPRDLPAGEYRTHAHILMTSDNVGGSEVKTETEGFEVAFKPRFRLSVPVSITVGDVAFQSNIESAKILPAQAGNPQSRNLEVWFTNSGNRSSVGDIIVTLNKGGQSYEVINLKDFIIYPGTARRRQEITVNAPEGVTLDGGALKLIYKQTKDNGGAVIAEKDLAL